MKVRELIERLGEQDPDLDVELVVTPNGDGIPFESELAGDCSEVEIAYGEYGAAVELRSVG